MIDLAKIERSKDPRRIPLEGRVLVAHQTEFLPWLGFVSKASMGDLYVMVDNSQFQKGYFENRNKIRIKSDCGWSWLTVPVKGKEHIENLDQCYIDGDLWKKKQLKAITFSYSRAKYFDHYFPELSRIYGKDYERIVDLNKELIRFAFESFNVNVPTIGLSELIESGASIHGQSTEWVISICKACGADVFVAGSSGPTYLDRDLFRSNGIELVFQQFQHPVYSQMHGGFIPNMSFIDLLFNHGSDSIEMLGTSGYETAK